MNKDDVSKLFTTNGEDAWRLMCYCAEPTVEFENLETHERIGGSIYSLNVAPFRRLVPEVRPNEGCVNK